jgi:hypothetical protein
VKKVRGWSVVVVGWLVGRRVGGSVIFVCLFVFARGGGGGQRGPSSAVSCARNPLDTCSVVLSWGACQSRVCGIDLVWRSEDPPGARCHTGQARGQSPLA